MTLAMQFPTRRLLPKKLGEWVGIHLNANIANGSVSKPTAQITATIYDLSDVSSAIQTVNLSPRDPDRRSNFYGANFQLDSGYSAGMSCGALVEYTISGATRGFWVLWDILAGGDADGNVFGDFFMDRPERAGVLYALDGGKLNVGTNPR